MAFLRIARLDEIRPGFRRVVRAGREEVLALEHQGEVRLVSNRCPHQGFPLAQGAINGESLICPRHGFRFNLRDGRCLQSACRLERFVPAYDGQWVGIDMREE